MIKEKIYKISGFCLLSLLFLSCEKTVNDGYRIDYNESNASLTVSTSDSTGAVGDTVVFSIQAKSDVDIKSIVVSGSPSGSGTSGFGIPSESTDPLVDHIFGTIQKNTREFNINYNYIITQDTADPVVTFKLIDQSGQKIVKKNIATLYSTTRYNSVILFTHSSSQTDGFSTIDSAKYRDLTRYATASAVNNAIQQSTDIIFIVANDTAYLVAPYDGLFAKPTVSFITNKTRFKLLTDVTSSDFDKIKSASLSAIIKKDSVKQTGSTYVHVLVGSVVGFFTDYNSTNSYKAGMLRVSAIHPSYCSWYTGPGATYQIEMDVIVQKN